MLLSLGAYAREVRCTVENGMSSNACFYTKTQNLIFGLWALNKKASPFSC